jgi:small subunit ribosomal protein S20
MPHTKSAKKNLKQSIRRRERNRAVKAELRTATKKVRAATTVEVGKTEFAATQTKLDRAAARGIIHKNKAARVKSRLAKALKKVAGK